MNDAPPDHRPGQATPARAKIFISYRRRETAGYAGRLYDGLVEHFGANRIFMRWVSSREETAAPEGKARPAG